MDHLVLTYTLKKIARVIKKIATGLGNFADKLQEKSSLSKSSKLILQRNVVLKNKHKGQRAFVIVNGPSLKNQNIDVLGQEITYVVSAFYRHPVVEKWQPTYYSILDKTFFETTEKSRIFFNELKEKIKDSTFFLPLFRGYKANMDRKLLPEDQTFYVATVGEPDANDDLTTVVQSFQSVSAFALAQAIYMGCSPIYLLGFDHDYLAYRGIDRHFYEGGTLQGHVSSHTPMSEMFTYDEEMMSMYKLWQNYRSLKAIAEKKGIEIFNATDGGHLDVFKRLRYESIFDKA